MAIAEGIKKAQAAGSMIRRMFEEGSALKKIHGNDTVFDFSLGNPDLEPPKEFNAVLLRLISENKPGSHGYMPNPGYPEVRAAIAKKASLDQDVSIDGAHIVMTVGAAGALNVVLKAILNPQDEVIVSKPYFVEYGSYISNHGGVMVTVASKGDFDLDVDAIAGALTKKTAAVLINSPHNPTGKIYPSATIAALAKVLKAHGKATGRSPYLIADEPYRELVYGSAKVPPILNAYDNSIVLTSYSKSLSLPGERIGYIAIGPKTEDVQELAGALAYTNRVLGYVNAPALMQRAVAELTEVRVDIAVYDRRRTTLQEVLDEAGIEYSKCEGAFYLFCKVPLRQGEEAGDDVAFTTHLKDYLILAVPGSGFGGPGWFRLAFCVKEEIIQASESAFKEAMKSWRS